MFFWERCSALTFIKRRTPVAWLVAMIFIYKCFAEMCLFLWNSHIVFNDDGALNTEVFMMTIIYFAFDRASVFPEFYLIFNLFIIIFSGKSGLVCYDISYFRTEAGTCFWCSFNYLWFFLLWYVGFADLLLFVHLMIIWFFMLILWSFNSLKFVSCFAFIWVCKLCLVLLSVICFIVCAQDLAEYC